MTVEAEGTEDVISIEVHVNTPVPETLWHYTSYAAAQAIISSKKIWATEYRYLNDREEVAHSKLLALRIADEETEETTRDFPAREVLRFVIEQIFEKGALQPDELRIMVASFSEIGDQLSQWRGYANNACGVSIGLDLRNLRPPRATGTLATFAPCVYNDLRKCALLRSVIRPLKAALKRNWDRQIDKFLERAGNSSQGKPTSEQIEATKQEILSENIFGGEQAFELYKAFTSNLLLLAPLLKNDSFSEEREWRLVLPWYAKTSPKLNSVAYRSVRDAIIPYIAIPLDPHNADFTPCNGLILGSGSHPASELGVNMFLASNDLAIKSVRSKVPYRPG